MKARLLLRERTIVGEDRFVEIVVWQLPKPASGSGHVFKYRMAFVIDGVAVVRFDNEAGKGDHKHIGETQVHYPFTSIEQLVTDFWNAVEEWSPQ